MTDPLFSVKDQIVLVSGGSRGIGFAIARGFAARGAHVIISSQNRERLAAAAAQLNDDGSNVTSIACDVSKSEQINQLVERVMGQAGRIDTLINVAGVNRRKPAVEVSESDYDFVMDVNLKGAFLLSQAVGRTMLERQSGCQINVASLNTDRPLKDVAPYAMSKAGLGHLTRSLALEWGPSGIRVNAIAPGFVLTDLTNQLWSGETMQAWGIANTPQRRLGQPDDMVGTALFLASQASAFMTGQTLYVDGGFTAGWAWPIRDA